MSRAPRGCSGTVAAMAAADDADDLRLLERAREGDEDAFAALVRRHSPSLLRVAQMYVPSRAVAEEVVQETWLGVLRGLEKFEGRSSFRTWLFRILVNRAKTRGVRERRTVPFAALAADDRDDDEPAVDPTRFAQEGFWGAPPRRWDEDPEAALRSKEALEITREAIDKLPEMQRKVITLRDIEGFPSDEVRNVLDISETNQRVLLHRARAKVRQALENWMES
jgi:RNA polymerase sigma-70 factor (ECF subfamily)